MQIHKFLCPHCEVPLRIKGRRLVGREIRCPECRQPVRVAETATGDLHGQPAEPTAATRALPATPTPIAPSAILSPTLIAWCIAGGLSAGVVGLLTLGGPASSTQPAEQEAADIAQEQALAPHRPLRDGLKAGAVADTPEGRLIGLHDDLRSFLEQHGHYPLAAVPAEQVAPEDRFGWMAVLAAQADPSGPQPRWDRPWRDAANDHFVRRSMTEFLNPAVPTLTSADRFPASHFVGVTGIGEDAASLPKGHPRAGMFGPNRLTTLDDVADGLANTILIAGVEQQLGSWAASGRATARSFTAEPFIRGPDGFGTGQADGMYVLMADGSVRFLSTDASPTIIRRMAAMADGLPLDPSVPGPPGDDLSIAAAPVGSRSPDRGTETTEGLRNGGRPSVGQTAGSGNPRRTKPKDESVEDRVTGLITEIADAADVPIDVPLAEPRIDVAAALAQPIARFEQSHPVAFRELLVVVEEMAGVPIRTDGLRGPGDQALTRPVTLSLSETTVGDILRSLLQRVGLDYVVERDGLRLIDAAGAADARPTGTPSASVEETPASIAVPAHGD